MKKILKVAVEDSKAKAKLHEKVKSIVCNLDWKKETEKKIKSMSVGQITTKLKTDYYTTPLEQYKKLLNQSAMKQAVIESPNADLMESLATD